MIHDLDFWRSIALGSVALGQTLFVALYLTFPWWKTFLGRALFYKALILMILADFAFLARVFDFAGEDVLFVILYGLLATGVWFQFAAFLVVKRNARGVVPERLP